MKIKKRPYLMTARAAKARATRERIIVAAIALYRERTLEDFTLEDVAGRADTTVQTVLRVFGSKEDLLFAALYAMAEGGTNLKATRPGDVAAAVREIFDVYEGMGDLVIRRLAEEARHAGLKPILDKGRDNHRSWLMDVFAPQLAKLKGSQRAQLLDILITATDVYVWKLLRRDRGLSRPAAEAVVRRIISSVTREVPNESEGGEDSLAQLVRRRQPAT